MNNTHYLLFNEDNNVVAVIRKENWDDRIIRAIEDETGAEVTSISFSGIGDNIREVNSIKAMANLNDSEGEYEYILRPAWEY
jgi:hypothetical protein